MTEERRTELASKFALWSDHPITRYSSLEERERILSENWPRHSEQIWYLMEIIDRKSNQINELSGRLDTLEKRVNGIATYLKPPTAGL